MGGRGVLDEAGADFLIFSLQVSEFFFGGAM